MEVEAKHYLQFSHPVRRNEDGSCKGPVTYKY